MRRRSGSISLAVGLLCMVGLGALSVAPGWVRGHAGAHAHGVAVHEHAHPEGWSAPGHAGEHGDACGLEAGCEGHHCCGVCDHHGVTTLLAVVLPSSRGRDSGPSAACAVAARFEARGSGSGVVPCRRLSPRAGPPGQIAQLRTVILLT